MDWTRRIHEPFIYAALAFALTAGFGYAAVIVGGLGLGMIPGAWWGAVVQAHGHAQLFGWLGLFVLGMGLYFLPKLRGANLINTARLPFALGLLALGITLRALMQPLLGFTSPIDNLYLLWRIGWGSSAVLELAGMLVILSVLRATERMEKRLTVDAPAYPVEPFAQMAFVSFALAILFNALGIWNALAQNKTTLAAPYDNLVITLMLYGVAVPMAIVFSVRNLPLFLRLAPPPRQLLRPFALLYGMMLLLTLVPSLGAIAADESLTNEILTSLLGVLGGLGAFGLDALILIFVWQLDLAHRRPPWTVNRAPNTRLELEYLRKPTRKNYPDAGEYGRFELLVYSAYAWLVVAVSLDIVRLLGGFIGWSIISQDATRHALTVGFITLLICGMAVRMAPGFSHKKGIAYPWLVTVTFILGNLAAVFRVVPTLFVQSELALFLFALSGAIAWLAIATLAVNVTATFRRA